MTKPTKPSGPLTYKIEKGADVWTPFFFAELVIVMVCSIALAFWL